MKFVDRIDEAARLKDALAREKSSLSRDVRLNGWVSQRSLKGCCQKMMFTSLPTVRRSASENIVCKSDCTKCSRISTN